MWLCEVRVWGLWGRGLRTVGRQAEGYDGEEALDDA